MRGNCVIDSPVLADERVEGLSGLLNSLVERFRRGVPVLTEDLVLRAEQALNSTHQLHTKKKDDISLRP